MIHLALPSDQKLSEALLVPLDRFYVSCCLSTGVGGSSPLHHGFWGGPQSGSNHFRLESGFVRFSPCRPFFVGPVAFFSVKPWEDGLNFQLDFSSQAFGRRCLRTLHLVLPC
jgi:hypothetical protein